MPVLEKGLPQVKRKDYCARQREIPGRKEQERERAESWSCSKEHLHLGNQTGGKHTEQQRRRRQQQLARHRNSNGRQGWDDVSSWSYHRTHSRTSRWGNPWTHIRHACRIRTGQGYRRAGMGSCWRFCPHTAPGAQTVDPRAFQIRAPPLEAQGPRGT